jgi:hypothetical protein
MTQTYIKTLTPKYALAGTTGSNGAKVGIISVICKKKAENLEILMRNGL